MAVGLLAVCAAGTSAQIAAFQTGCLNSGGAAAACAAASDIAEIAGLRALLLGAGGSPVAGTASTLGHRLPGSPRWSVTARMTGARIALPDPGASGATLDGTGIGWNADLAVGVIDGIPALATVGGVGSIDLLASLGSVNLPGAAGFRTRSPLTWGAGARVGVMRESFTVPGISMSAMYRRLGSFSAGDAVPSAGGVLVRSPSASAWSLRAGVGKRISLFGVTAGFGWDRLSSEIVADIGAPSGSVTIEDDSYVSSRTLLFGGFLWTRLVYSLSAEFGWQRGGGAIEDDRSPASDARGGGFFLSFSGRLVI
jgi:hypothetical protein